jgi:hypothetical protein
MTKAQHIIASLNSAISDTQALAADLSATIRAGRTPDDRTDPGDDPDDPGDPDDDTDKCECPCSACMNGRCSDCSASPCDDVNCIHRNTNDDDDDE